MGVFDLKLYIKEFREATGLSLTQLANKSKVSVSYLSEVERGQKMPSLTILCKIANGLGVNSKDLYDC